MSRAPLVRSCSTLPLSGSNSIISAGYHSRAVIYSIDFFAMVVCISIILTVVSRFQRLYSLVPRYVPLKLTQLPVTDYLSKGLICHLGQMIGNGIVGMGRGRLLFSYFVIVSLSK